MNAAEGVIKYRLSHRNTPIASTLATTDLNAWRHILFRLRLIGQTPGRYDGYGYGNISRRLDSDRFLISGTQTGHLELLEPEHFAVVDRACPESNELFSHGLAPPSSEALTHAILYRKKPTIGAVIHVHCPEIWRNSAVLKLPCTPEQAAYGTVEQVEAVKRLFDGGLLGTSGVFSMLGHEDGIVAFASDISQAATKLIDCLSRAIAIELQL